MPIREVASILYNVNVKKGRQKKTHKLYPLYIDKGSIKEFTFNESKKQYEAAMKMGWFKTQS